MPRPSTMVLCFFWTQVLESQSCILNTCISSNSHFKSSYKISYGGKVISSYTITAFTLKSGYVAYFHPSLVPLQCTRVVQHLNSFSVIYLSHSVHAHINMKYTLKNISRDYNRKYGIVEKTLPPTYIVLCNHVHAYIYLSVYLFLPTPPY